MLRSIHSSKKVRNPIISLFALVALLLTAPIASADHPIVGVWVGTQIEIIGGDDAGVTQVENPRILIYTAGGHFAWMFENADRPVPGENATDAQLAAALQNLNAAAGTYMIEGTTIKYIRRISGFPGGQLPENQPLEREIRAVTPTLLETSTTNPQGQTQILRYRRVE